MSNKKHLEEILLSASRNISRRRFVLGTASSSALFALSPSSFAANTRIRTSPRTLTGNKFDLGFNYQKVNFTGSDRTAVTIEGGIPAPTLRWKEGETVTLKVRNNLAEDSSIHWHGIILPTNMDGVPGLSFQGIKPGETFQYKFDVNQSGTYWYHSHSGFQEQLGSYGAIIIDPKEPPPFTYDQEYVVLLSDWTDEDPTDVYAKLKKMSHYYNYSERTAGDLIEEIQKKGVLETWNDRSMWNGMRMSDRDISDVNGTTYTFLMNGNTPADGWTGTFRRGEKVLLRVINAAAMTLFDFRVPGLKMKVVAADGQYIEPISVDEFRIGVAETYDVLVEPEANTAYTLFAQAIDRTGFARGTLTPNPSLNAEVPKMDPPPILTHGDMGMSHSMMGHDMGTMDHSKMGHDMGAMDHSKMKIGSGLAGYGSASAIHHPESEYGPHVDMRADSPQYMLDDPGIGLRDHQKLYGRKVLTYADIVNLYPTEDKRQPSREIQLHLTGNMSRYMWSINGIKFADAEPLDLKYGERVRITLINDTMMNHPIHLHGMWSELETGDHKRIPKKHTIIVQPGSKVSYLVTADARGMWAYHCHLLYHMMGMFRKVRVK